MSFYPIPGDVVSDNIYSYAAFFTDPDGGIRIQSHHRTTGAKGTYDFGAPGVEYAAFKLQALLDTHGYLRIAVDGLGHLHLWGCMHGGGVLRGSGPDAGALKYVRAVNAGGFISTWADMAPSFPRGTGSDAQYKVPSENWTYPNPIQCPDGTLRLFFRAGGQSGRSDSYIWELGPTSTVWTGPTRMFKGLSVANGKGPGLVGDDYAAGDTAYNWSAYPVGPFVQDIGGGEWIEHWFWNWRPNGPTTPADFWPSYMQYRSITGTWHTASGALVTLPVDPINSLSVRTNLIPDVGDNYDNGGGVYLDQDNNPHWFSSRNPFYEIYHDNSGWHQIKHGSAAGFNTPVRGYHSESFIFPVLFRDDIWYVGTWSKAWPQQAYPAMVRKDGTAIIRLGTADSSDAYGGTLFPGGGTDVVPPIDQYHLLKTGKPELMVVEGNESTIIKPAVEPLRVKQFIRTAPDAPAITGVWPGDGQGIVGWTFPYDGGRTLTKFILTPYIAGVAQTPILSDAITILGKTQGSYFTGTNGVTYTFKVAARNSIGDSPQSAMSAPMTLTAAVVDPFAGVASDKSVDVTAKLQAIINNTSLFPDGTLLAPTVIQLPDNVDYLVNGQITITRNHVRIRSGINTKIWVSTLVESRERTIFKCLGGSDVIFDCKTPSNPASWGEIIGPNDRAGISKGTNKVVRVQITATGGTYKLRMAGHNTINIPYGTTIAALNGGLLSPLTLPGIKAAGTPNDFTLTFVPPPAIPASFGGTPWVMTADNNLTGGTPSIVLTVQAAGLPDAYWGLYEAQHAFAFYATNKCGVNGWKVSKIFGDPIYARRYPLATVVQDLEVQNFNFVSCGRIMFTLQGNDGVKVHDGTVGNCRRAFHDFEDIDLMVNDVEFYNIVYGSSGTQIFLSASGGNHLGNVSNVWWHDCTSHNAFVVRLAGRPYDPGDGSTGTSYRGAPLPRIARGPFKFGPNMTAENGYGIGGANPAAMLISDLDGVDINGVTQPLQAGRSMALATLTNCADYDVGDTTPNIIPGGVRQAYYVPSVPVAARPDAPTALVGTGGVGTSVLTWNVPAANGSPITGWLLTLIRAGVPQTAIPISGTSSLYVVDTDEDISYTAVVRAVNAIGTSDPSSASAAFQSRTAPATTLAFGAGDTNLGTEVLWPHAESAPYPINWDAIGEYVAVTFELLSDGNKDLEIRYAAAAGPGIRRCLIDGVLYDATLDFPSTGSNWDSWGVLTLHDVPLLAGFHILRLEYDASSIHFINPDNLKIKPPTPAPIPGALPNPAKNVSARALSSVSAEVSFTLADAMTQGGDAITGYYAVCVSSNGGTSGTSLTSLSSPLTVSNLTPSKTYTAHVISVNVNGETSSLVSSAFTTPAAVGAMGAAGLRAIIGTALNDTKSFLISSENRWRDQFTPIGTTIKWKKNNTYAFAAMSDPSNWGYPGAPQGIVRCDNASWTPTQLSNGSLDGFFTNVGQWMSATDVAQGNVVQVSRLFTEFTGFWYPWHCGWASLTTAQRLALFQSWRRAAVRIKNAYPRVEFVLSTTGLRDGNGQISENANSYTDNTLLDQFMDVNGDMVLGLDIDLYNNGLSSLSWVVAGLDAKYEWARVNGLWVGFGELGCGHLTESTGPHNIEPVAFAGAVLNKIKSTPTSGPGSTHHVCFFENSRWCDTVANPACTPVFPDGRSWSQLDSIWPGTGPNTDGKRLGNYSKAAWQ